MDDAVDLKSPFFQLNRRKIYKWVFFLLKEHHERLGLKVMAWSGPSGIWVPRLSFYFDNYRNEDGSPRTHFDLNGHPVQMHTYQWNVGIFAPPRKGDPQEHPLQSKKELRTKDIVPWLNEQLQIQPLYHSLGTRLLKAPEDDLWKHRAERYLFSWNVLGLYLAKQPGYIRLETFGRSWDYVEPLYLKDAKRFLPEVGWEDVLVFRAGEEVLFYWLHSGRIVRPNGESLDCFQLHKGGLTPDGIVDRVDQFVGDSGRFSDHP